MIEPQYKVGDRVLWDGDEGVIDKVHIDTDPATGIETVWYTVDLGYTYVGAPDSQLEAVS